MSSTVWQPTNKEYHADTEAIGSSMLKDFLRSPALYYGRYVTGDIPRRQATPEMLLGTWTHCLVLEPHKWMGRYIIAPKCDRRTNAGKAAWQVFMDSVDGKEIIDANDRERVDLAHDMAAAVRRHRYASALLDMPGPTEQAIRWTDEQTGLTLKAKPDKLIPGGEYPIVPDLKTTIDPSPESFQKQAHNLLYHMQAALYMEGVRALTGRPSQFVFIAVGKEPPHDVWVHTLSERFARLGYRLLRDTLTRLKICQDTGCWMAPGQDDLCLLDPPRWAERTLEPED